MDQIGKILGVKDFGNSPTGLKTIIELLRFEFTEELLPIWLLPYFI